MRRCSKHDLAGSLPRGTGHWWRWHHSNGPDYNLRHCVIARVRLDLSNALSPISHPFSSRGKYGGFIGATWGIASVVGPLLGGVSTTTFAFILVFKIFDRRSPTTFHGDGAYDQNGPSGRFTDLYSYRCFFINLYVSIAYVTDAY